MLFFSGESIILNYFVTSLLNMIYWWLFMSCDGKHAVMQWSKESLLNTEGKTGQYGLSLGLWSIMSEEKVRQNVGCRVRQSVQIKERAWLRTSDKITWILPIDHLIWQPGCPGLLPSHYAGMPRGSHSSLRTTMRPIPGSAGSHSHSPGHSVGYQQQWTMASSQPLVLLDADCELATSHSHHSGWATWAGPRAGHPTERAGAWDSGSISPPDRRKATFLRPPASGRFQRNAAVWLGET